MHGLSTSCDNNYGEWRNRNWHSFLATAALPSRRCEARDTSYAEGDATAGSASIAISGA